MMLYDIEITRRANNRYVARVLLLPDVEVEATTRDEALERVKMAIRERNKAGVEIVQIAIDDSEGQRAQSSWNRNVDIFPDDDLYQQMLTEMQKYRQELDQEA